MSQVDFEVDGEPVELTLYDTGHPGYFIPFRDKTSGDSTYNPSCVYADAYSFGRNGRSPLTSGVLSRSDHGPNTHTDWA
ncbi:MAG: DUF1684 domain-containing protein [Actinomycetota bacterium]